MIPPYTTFFFIIQNQFPTSTDLLVIKTTKNNVCNAMLSKKKSLLFLLSGSAKILSEMYTTIGMTSSPNERHYFGFTSLIPDKVTEPYKECYLHSKHKIPRSQNACRNSLIRSLEKDQITKRKFFFCPTFVCRSTTEIRTTIGVSAERGVSAKASGDG